MSHKYQSLSSLDTITSNKTGVREFITFILASGSTKNSSKDIWDAEEVVEGSEYDCLHDPRPQPG